MTIAEWLPKSKAVIELSISVLLKSLNLL